MELSARTAAATTHGKRVFLGLVAATLAVAAGTGVWRGAGRAEWPPITDAGALRREATVLCRQEGGWRELLPAQYPPAMTALHPASISVSGERVYVALVPTGSGHQRFHGYSIWPDTAMRDDGGILREESDGENAGL